MTTNRLDQLRSRIAPLRQSLLEHPIYARIDSVDALRGFMEAHVFAVWDFMSLLKSLQRRLSCVDVPWTPPADPAACRLVNEIVLGEESDEDGRGGYASHFDLYLGAMRRCGADAGPISRFVAEIREGRGVREALEAPGLPDAVRPFVARTFDLIEGGDLAAIASAFTFGREDLLPDVFRRIVAELDAASQGGLEEFRHYLDRHIELDGDEHGPMAGRLVESLCGADPGRWQAAEEAAEQALRARVALWDGIAAALG